MDDHDLARRDEVLELLYWLEGEGIPGSATLVGMARFLTYSEDEVLKTLDHLVDRGYAVRDDATGEYRLTAIGHREGGRRFAESFAGLTDQGHGECSDPDCDCHTDPVAAVECHAARAHGGHAH